MKLTSVYKQTEAGALPVDWEAPELGEILRSTQLGGNYRTGDRDSGWPLIKMGNIKRGAVSLDKIQFIDRSETPLLRDRLRQGDLLLNTRNTPDLVGKVAIWRDELPEAYFNSNLMRLEFDQTRVVSSVLMNFILNTERSLRNIKSVAIGTTSVAAIYNRDLIRVRVSLPPVREQQAIADALSDANSLVESLEQLLAKKRKLKQAAMQELLTGKKRLPGFSGEWRQACLGSLGRCLRGVSYLPATDLKKAETDSTFCLLRSNNILEDMIVSEDVQYVVSERVAPDQRLRSGDIVICMANGSRSLVGKAARFLQDDARRYTFGAFMGCFRPHAAADFDAAFVAHLFHTYEYQSQVFVQLAGSSINNLTPASVESLEVSIPSDPVEQSAIAAILADIDAELAVFEAKLAKARLVKAGMMQELLTGRIRLV